MPAMLDYKVRFEVFEGPLDLLLYLIKKQEVDIYEVNLTELANQFIEYVELMRMLDLEIAGEFLVMAATLMYIKSRELLPRDQQATIEGEEDESDPRWELIRKLVEYKKFKDAAARLQQLEWQQENVYRRVAPKPDFEPEPVPVRLEVSIFDLLTALNNVLKRLDARKGGLDLTDDRWTVAEKMELLLRLVAERGVLKFSELFDPLTSRLEIIVTFLALLELIRLKQLVAGQSVQFGEIQITRAPAPVATKPVQEQPDQSACESQTCAQTASATITGAEAQDPGLSPN
ncbi:MAG: segregation/condensation protein A [Verrucomicrobiae bacterium]|nr:segregation/condensation protein A [Verrucomicrobiae bacterium]MCX7721771.1 segregation/condensation protein A [Verrucomicrobiae bacterium]